MSPKDFIVEDSNDFKGEVVELALIRVDSIPGLLAKNNPKLHDLGETWKIIQKYNFVDPSKIDMNLTNTQNTKGAFVYGNGRNEALHWAWEQWRKGEAVEIPNGVRYDGDYWYIPVTFGLDVENEALAKSLIIDHNNLTVLGGDIDISMITGLYDKDVLSFVVQEIQADGEEPITFDNQDIEALYKYVETGTPEAFPEYDETVVDTVVYITCPHCEEKFPK